MRQISVKGSHILLFFQPSSSVVAFQHAAMSGHIGSASGELCVGGQPGRWHGEVFGPCFSPHCGLELNLCWVQLTFYDAPKLSCSPGHTGV